MNNEELKSNLLSSRHWLRLVFMLLFAALLQVASIIMWVLVVLQFFLSLITGQDNINLRRFGLTYSSEEKPFPFADWPTIDEEPPVVEVVIAEKPRARTRAKAAQKKNDNDTQPDNS